MNWIMSILYLAFSFLLYNAVGLVVLKRLNVSVGNIGKMMVIGYLIILCVQWGIGFPCQLLHTSWNVYFGISLMVFIIILVYLFVVRNTYKVELKAILSKHVKRYWFLYICAIAFSLYSMSSSFAYFEMNYDDPFYIGSIVQEMNAPQLAVTNYFNGSYEVVSLERIFNTFGISYGFFAQAFHVDATFFAKGTMVFHNYSMIFICFIAFLKPLFKSDDNAHQYALLFFIILIIPAGYLAENGIIRMYDDWQFNTAIWYGSSIVRVAGLPILLMLGHGILKEFKIQNVILYILACLALLSLSSIAITFAIITTIWILLVLLYKHLKKNGYKLWKIILVLAGAIFVITWGIPALCKELIPGFEEILEMSSLPGYQGYRYKYLTDSLLLIICIPTLVINLAFYKDRNFVFFAVECMFFFAMTMSGMFDEFIMLISFNYNFVGLRLTTGIQFLCLALTGYCIYVLNIKRIKKRYIMKVLAIIFLIGSLIFNYTHTDDYALVTIESSGLSKPTFSMSRVLSKRNLKPNIYNDISSYFNNLNSNKHRIISMYEVNYEGSVLQINKGLAMTCHNIEVCTIENEGCVDIPLITKADFASYAYGSLPFNQVKDVLVKYHIEYVITPLENLESFDASEVVMKSKSDSGEILYLIKIL